MQAHKRYINKEKANALEQILHKFHNLWNEREKARKRFRVYAKSGLEGHKPKLNSMQCIIKDHKDDLKKIKQLEHSINERAAINNKLIEETKKANSAKEDALYEINHLERKIQLKRRMLNYNKRIKDEKAIQEEKLHKVHDMELSKWKVKYHVKLNKKAEVKRELEERRKETLKRINQALKSLNANERKEKGKWKKLQLKADYKVEVKERERVVDNELKALLLEKEKLQRQFSNKIASMHALDKKIADKQKEIEDEIKESNNRIITLDSLAKEKEDALEKLRQEVKNLKEEKERLLVELRYRKKAVSKQYLISILRFAKIREMLKKGIGQGIEKIKDSNNLSLTAAQKLKGKDRYFVKCHGLLLKADKAFSNKDFIKAKKLYRKIRNKYIELEYADKKDIYKEVLELYNKLNRAR
ncbi:hypothetical protein HYX01_03630 [Candidatus Woesearchaeota archaeon]|nr:hypothetical protein [Candidatus Woesearchaeota archaeon]